MNHLSWTRSNTPLSFSSRYMLKRPTATLTPSGVTRYSFCRPGRIIPPLRNGLISEAGTSSGVTVHVPPTGSTLATSRPHTLSASTTWIATRVPSARGSSLMTMPESGAVDWAVAAPATASTTASKTRLMAVSKSGKGIMGPFLYGIRAPQGTFTDPGHRAHEPHGPRERFRAMLADG